VRPGTRREGGVERPEHRQCRSLGAFTQLAQADAELDRLLASISEEREATERLTRAFDQALFTGQSRVRSVSDYIDTRRGTIGPRPAPALPRRFASSRRHRQRPPTFRRPSRTPTRIDAGIQAQTMANADVANAQRSFTGGGGYGGGGGGNMGAVLGGIIIGNILSGALRGGIVAAWRRRLEFDDVRRLGRRRAEWRRGPVLRVGADPPPSARVCERHAV